MSERATTIAGEYAVVNERFNSNIDAAIALEKAMTTRAAELNALGLRAEDDVSWRRMSREFSDLETAIHTDFVGRQRLIDEADAIISESLDLSTTTQRRLTAPIREVSIDSAASGIQTDLTNAVGAARRAQGKLPWGHTFNTTDTPALSGWTTLKSTKPGLAGKVARRAGWVMLAYSAYKVVEHLIGGQTAEALIETVSNVPVYGEYIAYKAILLETVGVDTAKYPELLVVPFVEIPLAAVAVSPAFGKVTNGGYCGKLRYPLAGGIRGSLCR